MSDADTLRCEVVSCFSPAVAVDMYGRRLCDPHYFERQTPHDRRWLGFAFDPDAWRRIDPVHDRDLHLIGVLVVTGAATHWPPGHYYAQCDVCGGSWVIGPDEYPYPVCHKCRERYERRCRDGV